MPWKITAEEIQQTFDLVYPLHPDVDVAFRVTMDACDVLSAMKERQARRKRSKTHYKIFIPSDLLLQYAVYFVSDYRERDQESPLPLLKPFYKPTRDDLIVRHVKHLIWKTTLLNYRYLAVGLGCLLYSYQPREIADLLGWFDENNLRHVKMRIARNLKERFAHFGLLTSRGTICTKAPSERDRSLVHDALMTFTPWQTTHFLPDSQDALILETLFNKPNLKSQWGVYHTLIDPVCGGIERLVNEYNGYLRLRGSTKLLADPFDSLVLPDFPDIPTPPLQRFKRRLLSEHEKMLLSERHNPTGPWVDDLEEYLGSLGLGAELLDDTVSAQAMETNKREAIDAFSSKPNVRILDFGITKSIVGDPTNYQEPDAPPVVRAGKNQRKQLVPVDSAGDSAVSANQPAVFIVIGGVGALTPAHWHKLRSADDSLGDGGKIVTVTGYADFDELNQQRDGGKTNRQGELWSTNRDDAFVAHQDCKNTADMKIAEGDADVGVELRLEVESMLTLCHQVVRRVAAGRVWMPYIDDLVQELLLRLWREESRLESEASLQYWVFKVADNLIKDHQRICIMDSMEQEDPLILERRGAVFKRTHSGSVYLTEDTRQKHDDDTAVIRLQTIVVLKHRGRFDMISFHRKELSKYMFMITPVFTSKEIARSDIKPYRRMPGDVSGGDGGDLVVCVVLDEPWARSSIALGRGDGGRGEGAEQSERVVQMVDRSSSIDWRRRVKVWQEEHDETRERSARPPRQSMKFECHLAPKIKPAGRYRGLNGREDTSLLRLPAAGFKLCRTGVKIKWEANLMVLDTAGVNPGGPEALQPALL